MNGQTTCPLCQVELDWKHLQYPNRPEVDHIKPVALGGTDTHDNLRVICAGCNRNMGAKLGRQIQLGQTPDQEQHPSSTAVTTEQELRTSRQW